MKKTFLPVVCLILLGFLGAFLFYMNARTQENEKWPLKQDSNQYLLMPNSNRASSETNIQKNLLNVSRNLEWTIISNETYGFEIRIPPDMSLETEGDVFIIQDRNEKNYPLNRPIEILVVRNDDSLSLSAWLEREYFRKRFINYNSKTFFSNEDDLVGVKMAEEGDPDHYNYYFSSEQYVFRISAVSDSYENVIRTFNIN
jgi:hypothetical protein